MPTFPLVFSVCRLFGDVVILFYICHTYSHSSEGFFLLFFRQINAIPWVLFCQNRSLIKEKNSRKTDRDVNFYLLARGRRRADARSGSVQLQVSSFTWWAWLESMQKSQPPHHTHTHIHTPPTSPKSLEWLQPSGLCSLADESVWENNFSLQYWKTKTKKNSRGGLVNKPHIQMQRLRFIFILSDFIF